MGMMSLEGAEAAAGTALTGDFLGDNFELEGGDFNLDSSCTNCCLRRFSSCSSSNRLLFSLLSNSSRSCSFGWINSSISSSSFFKMLLGLSGRELLADEFAAFPTVVLELKPTLWPRDCLVFPFFNSKSVSCSCSMRGLFDIIYGGEGVFIVGKRD